MDIQLDRERSKQSGPHFCFGVQLHEGTGVSIQLEIMKVAGVDTTQRLELFVFGGSSHLFNTAEYPKLSHLSPNL